VKNTFGISVYSKEYYTIPTLKMAVFWVVASCSLVEFTYVSEFLASFSIIRTMLMMP
jgi:hypothetical protein